ncbi:cyanophycinase [Roseateles sp.]|uniref:cyanophycinase n=1 Tax=Roseateles sp. TaxID=1971397 RepID=UPI00286B7140|nr:cyanophycinase [Roseateles sp.]
MRFKPLIYAAAAALLAAALPIAAATSATSANSAAKAPLNLPGTAIIIGGALKYDNDAVWRRIVEAAGGPGARFAVLATAAANPERSAAQIVAALNAQGARAEAIPVAPRLKGVDLQASLNDPALLAKVSGAQAVFFSGGAQELIVDSLQPGGEPTAMLKAIWSVFNRGGVVAGTSAGAAVMSTTMFRDAQDALKVMKGDLRRGKELDRGLGFVGPNLFIDQHFLKRGRIGRMLPLMLAEGYKLGLGVEENSAALLRGDEMEVIGAKGVLLVDLSQASSDPALPGFNIRNAQLSYLDRGDRHNFSTGLTTASAQKLAGHAIDHTAADFKPFFSNQPFFLDILGDNAIVNAMSHLLDSPHAELLGVAFSGRGLTGEPQPDLGFEFRLHKGEGSRGWFSGAMGGEDYTVLRLRLDVQPVQIKRPFYTPLAIPSTRTGNGTKINTSAGRVQDLKDD